MPYWPQFCARSPVYINNCSIAKFLTRCFDWEFCFVPFPFPLQMLKLLLLVISDHFYIELWHISCLILQWLLYWMMLKRLVWGILTRYISQVPIIRFFCQNLVLYFLDQTTFTAYTKFTGKFCSLYQFYWVVCPCWQKISKTEICCMVCC